MKKLTGLLVLCFVIYIVYHDVTNGTLPAATTATTSHVQAVKAEDKEALNYKMMKVKAGDTLLSIIEKERSGPLPVSIEQLIKDFESLNPGVKAESLQIGKTYKFPVYNE
ncbi:hypothetical protein B0I26_102402 [Anoxybacillus vitaminiphilus]|uniref:LysM domain-containing protein n=1 Tax=Paranoxybacillus vitaminiphilus TaxID=581036 RepID=A0A327YQF2_9BACL|nr:LysM peptidoglycan-binding domain-containing protein [Anoxybacillus vitaminiphilus]RAK22407.1 hypothetical protein B0I26_102402 [Anoxybacillus vitaminiphilus]